MAGIRISQLENGSSIDSTDYFPVARSGGGGSGTTYKLAASQLVTQATNIGSGAQLYAGSSTANSTTLNFRTLSGTDESLTISTIGNTLVINTSAQSPLKYKYSGDGTTKNFAIGGNLSKNINNYRVDIDGVLQEPGSDYSLAGSNITFSDAPPSASKVVIVTNNLIKVVDAIPSSNTLTYDMFTGSALAQIGTLVGASSWRFVTTNFSLTASERVGTIAAAALTGTLPLNPSAGSMVTIADTAYNWGTYNITISAAQTIEGVADVLLCDVSGKIITFLYNGATWRALW
jgi:hypothetical protein